MTRVGKSPPRNHNDMLFKMEIIQIINQLGNRLILTSPAQQNLLTMFFLDLDDKYCLHGLFSDYLTGKHVFRSLKKVQKSQKPWVLKI